MILAQKDLLGMKELSPKEIDLILATAETMKLALAVGNKKTSHLQGKSVITLFYENSTRTRLSFEMASKFMGASSANISASGSSVNKGESLLDTVATIDAMASDIIIMRHNQSGAPHLVAPLVNASIINAGDGMNEHPTQALLDMFTIKQKYTHFKGLKVAICGDIYHSRVARSNTIGLVKMGAQVKVAGPATMIPKGFASLGAEVCSSMEEAITDADVVMGLRVQLERQKKALFPSVGEYASFYGIDEALLKKAKSEAILMHPGPCNHGVEMTTSVYQSPQSVIQEQVTNGLAVRMAILYLLTIRKNVANQKFTQEQN